MLLEDDEKADSTRFSEDERPTVPAMMSAAEVAFARDLAGRAWGAPRGDRPQAR